MYLCVCNAISDREIRRCIEEGMDNIAQIKRHCHFERSCGTCSACIRAMINEHRQPAHLRNTVGSNPCKPTKK